MIPETVLVTVFSGVMADTARREILTPDELLQRIRTTSAPSKERLPWLKDRPCPIRLSQPASPFSIFQPQLRDLYLGDATVRE
jgi:hypothetical protein